MRRLILTQLAPVDGTGQPISQPDPRPSSAGVFRLHCAASATELGALFVISGPCELGYALVPKRNAVWPHLSRSQRSVAIPSSKLHAARWQRACS